MLPANLGHKRTDDFTAAVEKQAGASFARVVGRTKPSSSTASCVCATLSSADSDGLA